VLSLCNSGRSCAVVVQQWKELCCRCAAVEGVVLSLCSSGRSCAVVV